MPYGKNVIRRSYSLTRQKWYAMRHCVRKGRRLFNRRETDAANRDGLYYIREALALVTKLPVSGHKALF